MKTRFRKKNNIWVNLLLFITLGILLYVGIYDPTLATVMFIIWISITISVLNDYEINNRDRLKGCCFRINIHNIHKVVLQPDGVDIHYRKKTDGEIKMQHLRPKDKDALVKKLKEINHNIQII